MMLILLLSPPAMVEQPSSNSTRWSDGQFFAKNIFHHLSLGALRALTSGWWPFGRVSWLCHSCLRHSDCVTHDTDGRTKGVGDFRTRITNTTTTPQIRNRKLLTTYSPICDIPLVVVVASYIICQRQFVQYSLTRQILSSLLVKTFGAVFVGETNKKMVETFVGRTNHCLVDAVNAAELPVKESKMQEEAEKTMQWSLHQGVVCALCSMHYGVCSMYWSVHYAVLLLRSFSLKICSLLVVTVCTQGCTSTSPPPLTLSIHPFEM